MKVLMFGWEFPPLSSGGLGTACYGLTKGLSRNNISIIFVVPGSTDIPCDFARILPVGNLTVKKIDSILTPYMTSESYHWDKKKRHFSTIYGSDLFKEVYRYTKLAERIAEEEEYDIIHCHDWMTYGAGIAAKEISGKPLVIHVHATEFDRTGGNNVNEHVYMIEKEGMEVADRIIAVSNFTKHRIVSQYGINPEKVQVVHNAVEFDTIEISKPPAGIRKHDKIVLFLGRITLQKGPDYFIYAAKKVLEVEPNVKFIMAGSGDMERRMIEKAAEMGISDKVLFSGFLSGKDVDKAYKMADVYVMPSVSEPFGIAPLEAMRNNVPVIISKQSGVSEVIKSCLKVDFWDVNDLANKIIAVIRYDALHDSMQENGSMEIKKFSWDIPAKKCIEVYKQLLGVF